MLIRKRKKFLNCRTMSLSIFLPPFQKHLLQSCMVISLVLESLKLCYLQKQIMQSQKVEIYLNKSLKSIKCLYLEFTMMKNSNILFALNSTWLLTICRNSQKYLLLSKIGLILLKPNICP